MSEKNKKVEAFILSSLPSNYSAMCAKAYATGIDWADQHGREIDKGLQRLRKAGKITFERKGKLTIWSSAA